MHLYKFDEVDAELKLIPMAARRGLDAAGLKLSLDAWGRLPLATRRTLVELGSGAVVDASQVTEHLKDASPPAKSVAAAPEPAADAVPETVSAAFGPTQPIPGATWSALSPLDRFALTKVAVGKTERRRREAYAEIVGLSAQSTHLSPEGAVRMVSVGQKKATLRTAVAESVVSMSDDAFQRLEAGDAPKGDVLGTARLAGIMAAKRTADLVPLCHPLALTKVDVNLVKTGGQVTVTARVEAFDRTGVEMEALTAASVAALTVYDMLKAFDRGMVIGSTRLLAKTGGRSGDYAR